YKDYQMVHITPGQTPLEENYLLGKAIKKVMELQEQNHPSKVLLLCSGDLSHALSDDGPYVYHKSGPYFDEKIKEIIEKNDPLEFFRLNKKRIQEASQCGLRSFVMGFGYVDGLYTNTKVVSYEGPFGVGYLTGFIESSEVITGSDEKENSVLPTIFDYLEEEYERRIAKEDDFIRLARKSIETYVRTGRKLDIDEAEFSADFLRVAKEMRKGVFVSIHKDEQLRGCIGTIEASNSCLLEEILYNSISACSHDPRFHPVEEEELRDLVINVDILEEAEPIDSYTQLDPKKYGVIVTQGYKRGLLLPNLPDILDVHMQLDIAKQKAGITGGKVELARFEVTRHEIDE
ncbi:MAG: AmmeMemoRadiSam system protein A, partial [Vallitaleaceae bacterium]|nr:AmmeMemoRadiSam system protein A [Vallitaleaceae bacterium]